LVLSAASTDWFLVLVGAEYCGGLHLHRVGRLGWLGLAPALVGHRVFINNTFIVSNHFNRIHVTNFRGA